MMRNSRRPIVMRTLVSAVLVLLLAGTDAAPASASTLVVGDSLAVGMYPYLSGDLGPDTRWDAVNGRTTPSGMQALRAALRTAVPTDVIISLGTNDGPNPRTFRDRLRRTLARLPPDACVVWSAIYRPARKGPYRALNRVLREERWHDPRLTVVDWDVAVQFGFVHLPDGLHPDAAGYQARSRMFAEALARCRAGWAWPA